MVFFSPTIAAKRASTSGDIVRSGSSRRCRGEGGFIGSILGVVDVAGECICFRRRLKGCLMLPGHSFHAILPGLGVGGITHEACTLYEGSRYRGWRTPAGTSKRRMGDIVPS